MTQLGAAVDKFNEEKGREGTLNGENIRKRLAAQKKQRELQAEKDLESMINITAQTSAIQAINLSNLLSKKWTEEKDAYVILSKIKTYKQRNRLNELTSNRYIV